MDVLFINLLSALVSFKLLKPALAAALIVSLVLPAYASASPEQFAIDVSAPALAEESSTITSLTVGDKGIVVIANATNNLNVPVNATVIIQVIDQYGFTESIGFQHGLISAHRAMSVGIKWVPQKPGKFVMDAFAIDNGWRILSAKASSLVQIESKNASVKIPRQDEGIGNFQPTVAVVIMGYNNTVTWWNGDNRTRYIIADDAKSDFGSATVERGPIRPDDTFTYTFAEPGRYGYHGNGFHGTVIVLPDPYQGYEKVRDSRIPSIDLDMYGSYDPTLAGHFAKGHIYDGLGRPIANGTVTISANGAYMGNATSDVEGCFDFQSFNAEPIAYEKESAYKEGKSWVDLTVLAVYDGDGSHFWGSATEPARMYLAWPPSLPAEYEASIDTGGHYNATTGRIEVTQGEAIEARLAVKPTLKQYEVDSMSLDLQRVPCGVSATVSGQDNVSLDHAGTFRMTIDVEEYAKPGVYFILVSQDPSQVKNLFAHDPSVTGFLLEIKPK